MAWDLGHGRKSHQWTLSIVLAILLQIIGGYLGIVLVSSQDFNVVNHILLAFGAMLALLSVISGLLLVYNGNFGYRLSIINFGLQMISFSLTDLCTFHYNSGFHFSVGFTYIDEFVFKLQSDINTEMDIAFGAQQVGNYVFVNLVAIYMFFYFIKYNDNVK